jgi:hypothetical protein
VDQQRTTTYERDGFGNVLRLTEEVQTGEPMRSTSIAYDDDNVFPATITNSLGQATHLQFDARWGTPAEIVDANGPRW